MQSLGTLIAHSLFKQDNALVNIETLSGELLDQFRVTAGINFMECCWLAFIAVVEAGNVSSAKGALAIKDKPIPWFFYATCPSLGSIKA